MGSDSDLSKDNKDWISFIKILLSSLSFLYIIRIMVNILSIDVEGFIESNQQSFSIPPHYFNAAQEKYEIEKNIEFTLELLSESNVHGTFFFVGRLAHDLPNVIKNVARAGHEIGCHNFEHVRLFDITAQEFREKLKIAKLSLEDVSGERVSGFRAPEFSITNATLWALDILKELDFIYDSSIYPIGMHDVYGMKDAKPFIHKLPNELIEVPLSTFELRDKRFPFGGGGYFRLFPLFITKFLLRQANKQGHPVIFYIHPYEIGPEIPHIRELSAYRKFRHYYHCKNGGKRLTKILKNHNFSSIINVLRTQHFL